MTSKKTAGSSMDSKSMEDIKKLRGRLQNILDELSRRTGDEYLYLTINIESMSGKCQGSEVSCNFINKNLNMMYELYRFCVDAAEIPQRKRSKRSGVSHKRHVNRGKDVVIDFSDIKSSRDGKISQQKQNENVQEYSVIAENTQDISSGTKTGFSKEHKSQSPTGSTSQSFIDPTSQSPLDPTSKHPANPTLQKPVILTSQRSVGPTSQKLHSKTQLDQVHEKVSSQESFDKYSKEKGQFECENCGLILSWKKSYYRHKRIYCTSTADKPPDVNSDINEEPDKAESEQESLEALEQVGERLSDAQTKSVDESHTSSMVEDISMSLKVINNSEEQNDKIEREAAERKDLELAKDITEPHTLYTQVLQEDDTRDGSGVPDGSILGIEGQETLQYSNFHGVFYKGEDVSKYFEGDMSLSTREKGNFKCKKCGKLLQWKKSFVRHLLSSSCVQGSEQDNGFIPSPNENGKFRCKKCGVELGWKKSLLRHMRSNSCSEQDNDFIPVPNENGKFKCKKCGVEMECEKSLLRHMRSNTCLKDTKQNELTDDHTAGRGTEEMSYLKANEQALNPSNITLPKPEGITYSTDFEASENCELDLSCNDGVSNEGNSISTVKLADTFRNGECNVSNLKLENANIGNTSSLQVGQFEISGEKTDARTKRLHRKQSTCKVCNLTFPSKEKYLQHVKIHRTKNQQSWYHKCDICNKSFSSRLGLASHRVIIHKKNETFTCRKCQHKFKSWNDYRQHFKRKLCTQLFKCSEHSQDYHNKESHTDNNNMELQCIECKRNLNDKTMLKQKKKYVCEICNKDFEKFFHYQRHKFTHTHTKSYKCHKCQKSYFQVRYLYSHYLEVHKEKYSICKYCGMLFPFKSVLMDHMRSHHKVGTKISTCCYCNMEFDCRTDYLEHLRIHSVVSYSICEICGKSFTRPSNLRKHILTHSEMAGRQCEYCGKTLRSESGYRSHIQLHKAPDTRKKYQCDECGEFFSAPQVLRKHKLTHVEEPMFKCDTCSEKFRTKEGLNYHRTRLHLMPNEVSKCGFKIRECKYCGKLISQKQTYLLHMSHHTGEKPYKCNICDRSYALKALLNRHLVAHRKPYKCDICDTRFSCKSKWKRHVKSQKHISECQRAGIDVRDSQFSLSEDRTSTGDVEGLRTRENEILESDVKGQSEVTTVNAQIITDQELERSVEGIEIINQKEQNISSENVQQVVRDTNEQGVVSLGDGEHADVGCIILSITPDGYENPVNISFNIGANEAVHMAM